MGHGGMEGRRAPFFALGGNPTLPHPGGEDRLEIGGRKEERWGLNRQC
jgi:hypothetical protein